MEGMGFLLGGEGAWTKVGRLKSNAQRLRKSFLIQRANKHPSTIKKFSLRLLLSILPPPPVSFYIEFSLKFLFLFYEKIFIVLTVLSLCCCMGFSLVAASGGCSSFAVYRLLIAVASLVLEHRL